MAQMMKLVALLHEAVEAAIKDGRTTKEGLLILLDKAPSTLNNELNPFPTPNKLGLEDAWKIVQAIGDTSVMGHMASQLGFTLRHMAEHRPDAHDMAEECLQGLLAVAKFAEAARNGTPCADLSPLLEDAISELQDVWKRAHDEQAAKPSQTRRAS